MNPRSICGINVQIAPEVPKYKLPEDLPLSPEFRSEFNAWALKRFGTTCIVSKDKMYMIGKNTVVMQQAMYDKLKKVASPNLSFGGYNDLFNF